MKYNSIGNLFTAIADEIREIEGTDNPINPQDFPERIKKLNTGVASVPTLECWKITITNDNLDAVHELINYYDITYGGNNLLVTTHLKSIDYDLDTYAPGSLVFLSSGPLGECMQELYILFYKTAYREDYYTNDLLVAINNAQGEKISLNNWLEITAQAENIYEE